jgi:fermentation-respiration switch protein FrsA (DUF1100 family)
MANNFGLKPQNHYFCTKESHDFMFKRILTSIIILSVLIFLCLLAAGNYMVTYSLQPSGLENSMNFDIHSQEIRANHPQIVNWLDSMEENSLFRDTFIVSKVDGSKLHAIYAYADKPTACTAVLAHGYTDCIVKMLPIAYLYNHDLNFNILMMDHHGHGKSEGDEVQMGWLDRLDVLQWMKVAHDVFSKEGVEAQLVMHGISMGAAIVMYVSGEVEGNGPAAQLDCVKELLPMSYVKCFIEDCGYSSVWEEFSGQLDEQFHLSPFPIMNVSSLVCKMRYGWWFEDASSIDEVERCSLPMLFIHGDEDTFVPTEMVHKVYAAKPEPKELWITTGVGHAASYQTYPLQYTKRVADFVGRYMK